jgi:hypothetical protein
MLVQQREIWKLTSSMPCVLPRTKKKSLKDNGDMEHGGNHVCGPHLSAHVSYTEIGRRTTVTDSPTQIFIVGKKLKTYIDMLNR